MSEASRCPSRLASAVAPVSSSVASMHVRIASGRFLHTVAPLGDIGRIARRGHVLLGSSDTLLLRRKQQSDPFHASGSPTAAQQICATYRICRRPAVSRAARAFRIGRHGRIDSSDRARPPVSYLRDGALYCAVDSRTKMLVRSCDLSPCEVGRRGSFKDRDHARRVRSTRRSESAFSRVAMRQS
jgi:hypothetical protein